MIIVQKHRILTQLDLDLVYGILPRTIQHPVRSMLSSNLPPSLLYTRFVRLLKKVVVWSLVLRLYFMNIIDGALATINNTG